MIIGTAGHIDHGKTALVRVLTGIDTDRLPEERRRGITIELGFAPIELPGVGRAAVVDVPGHEAFVRTMLAGASGVDIALLVVAADEGVMPQTREHVAILSLLGVRSGVVALTKADLVEADWLSLVADEVRDAVKGSAMADAQIVAVSSVTGAGIEALRGALAAAAAALPPRHGFAHFRMPVDRTFSVRGTGTVVTGTVWSGSAARDGAVTVYPGGQRLRVRGVEQHGAPVGVATAGSRAALALAGAELDAVPRGAVLVDGDGWQESRILRATVELLPDAPPLRPRSRLRLHLGTADVGARVVTAGGPLQPGERKGARLVIDSPIVARGGDRFVLRTASPTMTVGGGVVSDPHPPHRRSRPWPADLVGASDMLAEMLTEGGVSGVSRVGLPVRLGMSPAAATSALEMLGDGAVQVGDRVFAGAAVERTVAGLVAAIEAHHAAHPLDPGLSRQHARSQLGASPALVEHALALAFLRRLIAADGSALQRAGWSPTLTASQSARRDALFAALVAAGREPGTLGELAAALPGPVAELAALARLLEREGRVVPVEADRLYASEAVAAMAGELRAGMEAGRIFAPSELRDLLGVSRKFLIPLLEYFDRTGVTRRVAEGRALAGT